MSSSKMDSSVVYQRNKNKIREIHQNVEIWEKNIQNAAEKLEREKLRKSKSKNDGRWIRMTTQLIPVEIKM